MVSASSLPAARATVASRTWLCGILLFSFVLRAVTAVQLPAPWLVDVELAQTAFARSIATPGTPVPDVSPEVRRAPLYAVTIAPLFLVDSLPHAYALLKLLNALLVSLAVIPVYALARRVVPVPWALVAAGLSVGTPSLAYTSAAVPDNLLFPLVAWFVLALVGVLERPTLVRQAVLWGVVGLACATRSSAAALVPGVAAALVAWCVAGRVRLGALVPSFVAAAALGAGLVAIGAVPLEPVSATLAAKLAARHVGALALVHGIVPFAAFVGFVAVGARPVALGMLAVALPVVVAAGVAAARRDGFSILERDVFALAPLGMVALVWWGAGGVRVGGAMRVGIAALVGGAAFAPWLLPGYAFSRSPDALGLLAFHGATVAFGDGWTPALRIATVAVAGVGAVALVVPRLARGLPIAVALVLVVVHVGVERQLVAWADGVRWPVLRRERDWVDRKVPRGERVVAVRAPAADMLAFFNRSVVGIVDAASIDTARPRWVVAPDGVTVGGAVVARDAKAGVTLTRVGAAPE